MSDSSVWEPVDTRRLLRDRNFDAAQAPYSGEELVLFQGQLVQKLRLALQGRFDCYDRPASPHPDRKGAGTGGLAARYGMTCAPLRYAAVDRSGEQDAALASYAAALLCGCGILAVRRCVVCDDAVCESHSNLIFDSARPRYVSGACDACNESARRTQLAKQEAYDRYLSHVEAAARRLLAEEGLARLCDLRAARWSSVATPRGYRVVDFDAGDSEHGERVIVVDRRLRFFDWYRGRKFSSNVGYYVSRRGSFMSTDVGALDLARREVLAQGLVARPD